MWVLALDPWKTYFLPPKFSVFNGKMKTTIFALLSTHSPLPPSPSIAGKSSRDVFLTAFE